jgi:hypothetical protein
MRSSLWIAAVVLVATGPGCAARPDGNLAAMTEVANQAGAPATATLDACWCGAATDGIDPVCSKRATRHACANQTGRCAWLCP